MLEMKNMVINGALLLALVSCGPTQQEQFNEDHGIVTNELYPDGAPLERTGTLEQSFTIGQRSLTFSDGKYSGNTGCNDFSGSYQLVGADRVIIQPMIMTRKACPNLGTQFMSEEANFGRNLPGEYTIKHLGATMVLVNDQRSWTFARSTQ